MNTITAAGPEQTNFHATLLVQLAEGLDVPYTFEPSMRLCRGAILGNRFLLTIRKEDLREEPAAALVPVCRRLAMPETLVGLMHRDLPASRFVHFGFEEKDKTCLIKLYLEFGFDAAALPENFLLHRAFKWEIGDPSRHVETQYVWYPRLSVPGMLERMARIYAGSATFEIVQGIVETAAQRGRPLQYLEVSEDANDRRSFDVNLYDADLRVRELAPSWQWMVEHFGIDVANGEKRFNEIKDQRLGHLAGGVHRGGEDFFNLYYGAEKRSAKKKLPRTAWTMGNVKRLQHTSEQDQYYNYCWWPYLPVAPVENKYRPINLLQHSFEVGGLDERAVQLVEAIQAEIGMFRTVWGAKWLPEKPTPLGTQTSEVLETSEVLPGRLGWEFYFYDYQRRQREVSIARLLKTIRPLIRCDVPVQEGLPYFMFSLDVDAELLAGARALDVVHMYIGNPGSKVSSGIAYALRAEGTTLENFYFFFDAKRDLREAAEKIYCSAHVDSSLIDIDRLLIPELRDCHTICVANKQKNDTVYFSGVNVDQFLFFLKMLHYPPPLIAFVEENRGKLDHLLYDVGFDYVAKGSEVEAVKSGYYGVF